MAEHVITMAQRDIWTGLTTAVFECNKEIIATRTFTPEEMFERRQTAWIDDVFEKHKKSCVD